MFYLYILNLFLIHCIPFESNENDIYFRQGAHQFRNCFKQSFVTTKVFTICFKNVITRWTTPNCVTLCINDRNPFLIFFFVRDTCTYHYNITLNSVSQHILILKIIISYCKMQSKQKTFNMNVKRIIHWLYTTLISISNMSQLYYL